MSQHCHFSAEKRKIHQKFFPFFLSSVLRFVFKVRSPVSSIRQKAENLRNQISEKLIEFKIRVYHKIFTKLQSNDEINNAERRKEKSSHLEIIAFS